MNSIVILAQKKHIIPASQVLTEGYYITSQDAVQSLKENVPKKQVLIAINNKNVVGVLIYTRDFSHYANYIQDIIVSKKERGKGISQLLLKKYVDISKKEQPKKQKYTLSSTHLNNKTSIAMHKKFGFKEIGRIKKLHYGTDEIIFGYKLR